MRITWPPRCSVEHRVVRLGVTEDQRDRAERDGAGDQPLDERGLAGAGLAEDEHARVGDQPGAQPRQRVQADHLAPQLVPSDRRPGCRGAADPATNGNRPHACAVVAWYSGAAGTWAARPAQAIFQPHAGGTCPPRSRPRAAARSRPAARRSGRRQAAAAGARPWPHMIMARVSWRLVRHPAGQSAGQIPHGSVAANPAAWL